LLQIRDYREDGRYMLPEHVGGICFIACILYWTTWWWCHQTL